MYNKKKALDFVLTHNNLNQTVLIVELLLDGKSQKEISEEVGVKRSWVSRVKNKYIKGVLK